MLIHEPFRLLWLRRIVPTFQTDECQHRRTVEKAHSIGLNLSLPNTGCLKYFKRTNCIRQPISARRLTEIKERTEVTRGGNSNIKGECFDIFLALSRQVWLYHVASGMFKMDRFRLYHVVSGMFKMDRFRLYHVVSGTFKTDRSDIMRPERSASTTRPSLLVFQRAP